MCVVGYVPMRELVHDRSRNPPAGQLLLTSGTPRLVAPTSSSLPGWWCLGRTNLASSPRYVAPYSSLMLELCSTTPTELGMHPLSVGGLPCVGNSRGHSLIRRPCRTLSMSFPLSLAHMSPAVLAEPFSSSGLVPVGSLVDPFELESLTGPFLGPT